MSYKRVGTHRNWQIWQKNGRPELVGNMILAHAIEGGDLPDLKADIDEAMISRLGAFEAKITGGRKPKNPHNNPHKLRPPRTRHRGRRRH